MKVEGISKALEEQINSSKEGIDTNIYINQPKNNANNHTISLDGVNDNPDAYNDTYDPDDDQTNLAKEARKVTGNSEKGT